MDRKHQTALEEIENQIDAATAPARMSQPEAKEFLEELRDNLQARIDALNEEIGGAEPSL